MPNKRIDMNKAQEIQRLKKLCHSKAEVARLMQINRETVAQYWNQQFPPDINAPIWTIEVDWEYLKKELHKGIPRKILYEELTQFISMPSYQAFCQYLRNRQEQPSPNITIRIHRTPGDSVEVDYSGDGHCILNPATGELQEVELFVGCLSYSTYFFAEFTLSQRLEDFITCHNHMFFYFKGVPRYAIPDNCKTAISKTDRYEPLANKTYQDMCEHYGIAIDPADPASPRHKPNVERAIGMIQKGFLPRIRHKKFTSLIALNRELRAWVDEVNNNAIIRGRGQTREFFYQKELAAMSPLPYASYDLFCFTKRKVHPDCHLQHNKNYYSVPYKFVGREVDVKFNSKMVYVYWNCELVATHTACKGSYHYSTNANHYPEKKYVETNYHLNKARRDAAAIGENVELLIDRLSREAKHPLKILRKAQGILGLSKTFSKDALSYACAMALEFDRINYDNIKRFAKNYKKEKKNTGVPKRQLELIFLQGEQHEGNSRSC